MNNFLKSSGLCLFASVFALVASLCALQATKYSARNMRQEMRDTERSLSINSKDAYKLLDSKIEELKSKVDSRTNSTWHNSNLASDSAPPKRSHKFMAQGPHGGSYVAVIEIEGRGDNASYVPESVIVRKEFQGVVYVQNNDGSFKVVKP